MAARGLKKLDLSTTTLNTTSNTTSGMTSSATSAHTSSSKPNFNHQGSAKSFPPPLPLEEFLCPIGLEMMKDPVTCSDGYSYERANIEEWLKKCNRSPKTNLTISDKKLVPNTALRSLIERSMANQSTRPRPPLLSNMTSSSLSLCPSALSSQVNSQKSLPLCSE